MAEPNLTDFVAVGLAKAVVYAAEELIKKQLRLNIMETPNDGVEFQLMLGKEPIGDPHYLELNHDGDDIPVSELFIGVD